VSGKISFTKRKRVYAKTNSRCGYCGIEVSVYEDPVDHIVPRSLGGNNSDENLMACCHQCNASKGNRSLEEFRLWLVWRDFCREKKFSVYQISWLVQNTNIAEQFPRENMTFYFEEAACEH